MAYVVCMGFTTIATAAAIALPKVMESVSLRQQSKQLAQAANVQQRMANRQADTLTATAVANQQRATRNANDRMNQAVADAVVSNLTGDGSARVREMDLATRLQDEITNTANTSLQQAHATREQGAFTAWNTRNTAARAKQQSHASLFSGVGSLFGSLAGSLSSQHDSASASSRKRA